MTKGAPAARERTQRGIVMDDAGSAIYLKFRSGGWPRPEQAKGRGVSARGARAAQDERNDLSHSVRYFFDVFVPRAPAKNNASVLLGRSGVTNRGPHPRRGPRRTPVKTGVLCDF